MSRMAAEMIAGNPPEVRKRATRSVGVLVGLMVLGVAGLLVAEWQYDVVLNKPPAPLSKPLPDLPLTLGDYEAAVGRDRKLPDDQVSALGTDDYLLRQYTNTRWPNDEAGKTIALNLNYYATGSATPHVPDICWAGAGMVAMPGYDFVVPGVKHKDGSVSDLTMHMAVFAPRARHGLEPEVGSGDRALHVAYVFQVNGRYVALPAQVSKSFWNPRHKYAYHAKIEITPVTRTGEALACTPKEAEAAVAEFIRASLAQIEECLPDQAKLEGDGAAASGNPGGGMVSTQGAAPSGVGPKAVR